MTTAAAPVGLRTLTRLAAPIVAGSIVTVVLSGNDTFLLGRFGAPAVAAASIAVGVQMVCAVLVAGLAVAAHIHTARHTGAGDPEAAARVAAITAGLAGTAGMLLTLGLLAGAGPITAALAAQPELAADAAAYLRVIALGLPFVAVGAALRGFAAGIGRPGVVLLAGAVAGGADVLLALALIAGGGPPIAVAWATAGASALSTLVVVVWLVRAARRGIRVPRLRDLSAWRTDAGPLWRTGWPEAVQLGLGTLSMVLVVKLLSPYGTAVLAAARTLDVVVGAVWTVLHGCGTAVTVLAGQRMGAGDATGVRQAEVAGWRLVGLVGGIPLLSGVAGTPWLVGLLVDDPAVAAQVSIGVTVLAWAQVAGMAAITVTNGLLRAAGDTRTGLRASLIAEYAVFVPLGLLLCRVWHTGLAGLYLAHLAYWAIYLAVVARRRRQVTGVVRS
jgi:MATE family multidrug resistance protein